MFARLKHTFVHSTNSNKAISTKHTYSTSNLQGTRKSVQTPQFVRSQVKNVEQDNISQSLSQVQHQADDQRSQIGQLIKQFASLGQKFNEISEQLNERLSEQFFIQKQQSYKQENSYNKKNMSSVSPSEVNSSSYIDKLQVQLRQNEKITNPIQKKLQKQRSQSKTHLSCLKTKDQKQIKKSKEKLSPHANIQQENSAVCNIQVMKRLVQENKLLKEENKAMKQRILKLQQQQFLLKKKDEQMQSQLNCKLMEQQIQFKNYINSLNHKINELVMQNVKQGMKIQEQQQCIVGILNQLNKMQMQNIDYIQVKSQYYELRHRNNELTVKNQQLSKKVYNFSGPVEHLWAIKQIQYQNIKSVLKLLTK